MITILSNNDHAFEKRVENISIESQKSGMLRSKGDLSDPTQPMNRNIVIRKPVRKVAYEQKPVPVKKESHNTTRNEADDKANENFKDVHYENKSTRNDTFEPVEQTSSELTAKEHKSKSTLKSQFQKNLNVAAFLAKLPSNFW